MSPESPESDRGGAVNATDCPEHGGLVISAAWRVVQEENDEMSIETVLNRVREDAEVPSAGPNPFPCTICGVARLRNRVSTSESRHE
jgi:hypothetical protein